MASGASVLGGITVKSGRNAFTLSLAHEWGPHLLSKSDDGHHNVFPASTQANDIRKFLPAGRAFVCLNSGLLPGVAMLGCGQGNVLDWPRISNLFLLQNILMNRNRSPDCEP